MKIILEELPEGEEEQVIFRTHGMSAEMLHIIAAIKAQDAVLAYDGNTMHRIRPPDIYYFEAVDNKVFLYCRAAVLEVRQKLYELEELLESGGFIRISKSILLNMKTIRSLSPAHNGRFEARLENDEKVIISRQYVNSLKKRLGML